MANTLLLLRTALLVPLSMTAFGQPLCNTSHGTPAVALPIREVAVTGSNGRRGMPLGLGSPSQVLSFEVSAYSNNTVVYSPSQPLCEAPAEQCVVLHGGEFDKNFSSSWLEVDTMALSGAAPEKISSAYTYTSDTWGKETLSLNDTLTVASLPIDLTNQHNWAINGLGLGSNSTILSRLKSSGTIASASWSMFYGLLGFQSGHEQDGTVVLGGYDVARTSGPRLDSPVQLGTACRTNLLVTLLDVVMEYSGQSRSILTAPEAVCIDPGMTTIALASKMLSQFISLAGGRRIGNSTELFYRGLLYEPDGV